MAETFKQLVLMGKGGPWELVEKPIPEPGVGQFLVKVLRSSICGQTDLNTIKALHPPHDFQTHFMNPHDLRVWDNRIPDELSQYYPKRRVPIEPYPTTMGHEGMGIIVKMGPMPENHHGDTKNMHNMGRRPFQIGDRVALVSTVGGYGEYVISDPSECVLAPDDMPDEVASLYEPVYVVHNVVRQVVTPGDDVLVLGQGCLGLMATQLAKIYGATRIITAEPVAFKRELSKKFGADAVIDPTKENIVHAVEDLTDGEGCRVVLECAGVPETTSILPYVVKFGGSIGQIGACCVPVLVDWSYIHFKGVKITCQIQSTFVQNRLNPMDDLTMRMMQMMDLESMITHRIPLTVEATNDIFAKIDKGDEVVKAVYEIADK